MLLEVMYFVLTCVACVTLCVLAWYTSPKTHVAHMRPEALVFVQKMYRIMSVAVLVYGIAIGIIIAEWYEQIVAKDTYTIVATIILICGLIFQTLVLLGIRKHMYRGIRMYAHVCIITLILLFSIHPFSTSFIQRGLQLFAVVAIWGIMRYGILKYTHYFLR